MILALYSEV